MDVSFNEVKLIADTLPVGYYIKRRVDITISETANTAYYDPMHDLIVIGYKVIKSALKNVEDFDLETAVRTLLYHEVSHAYLTPIALTVNTQVNVFEDERIETLLSDFYLNTDFKSFIKIINNFKGEAAKTADQAFYHLVRYRIGPQDLLDKVNKIIYNYRKLTRLSDYCEVKHYYTNIMNLYNEVCDRFRKRSKTDHSSKQNDKSHTNEVNEMNGTTANNIDCSAAMNDAESKKVQAKMIRTLFQESADEFEDNDMTTTFTELLCRVQNSSKKNGSAINTYSGVFDPRSASRNDYKFFVQKNRLGHVKAFSKIHLNLFIDRSGSFKCSEVQVNKLLKSLLKIEQQYHDFSFDLVTCQIGEKLHDKNDRVLHCYGGNCLDRQIYKLYDNLQLASATNYNVVLFDGYAFSDSCNTSFDQQNFDAFNHPNCTIISDSSNEPFIYKYSQQAKAIITDRYAEELCQNVICAMQMLMR